MSTKQEAIIELYKMGKLPQKKQQAVEELIKRGIIKVDAIEPISTDIGTGNQAKPQLITSNQNAYQDMEDARRQAINEIAEDVGPLQSFMIGVGKGFYNVGRGIGILDPAEPEEIAAMEALNKKRPYTAGAGEIIGESTPFLPLGAGFSRLATKIAGSAILPLLAAAGLTGAIEGGITQKGKGQDPTEGAILGATISAGVELLIPIIGKLGRKIVQKVKGRVNGAMLDAAGRPTPELQEALTEAGLTFDDLTEDALEVIKNQIKEVNPNQLARKTIFTEEQIPATRGDITQDYKQLSTENRLIESANDTAANRFRDFKLKQSEAIKERLRSLFGEDIDIEGTGELIEAALSGRQSLLNTQKNDLYRFVKDKAKNKGGIPLFTDNIKDAIPFDEFEDLAITSPKSMKSLEQLLEKYGLKPSSNIKPELLSIENFERFRKSLNAIKRGDKTRAVSVAISPIIKALDQELDKLGTAVGPLNLPAKILIPLKKARKTVRQVKTEFSPQSFIGKIVGDKADGVTPVIHASKIYNKISSGATPVEDVRSLITSLSNSGAKGEQAKAALQSSIILDLIDSSFNTESKKISGVRVFNPTAFKRRLKSIGEDKIKAVFKGDMKTIRSLKNIDKIASDLIPPSGAVPKGSATVILDLANKLGLASITAKIPGGALLIGGMKKIAEPVKMGIEYRKAITPDVEAVKNLKSIYPNLINALAVSTVLKKTNQSIKEE